MSFEVFVAMCLVGFWALLPASLALAVKTFDDELITSHDSHD